MSKPTSLALALDARGDVDAVADGRIVEAASRAPYCPPAPRRSRARCRSRCRSPKALAALSASSVCAHRERRQRRRVRGCSGTSTGAFQNAMMASPMNLSMVPERSTISPAQRAEQRVEHAERFGRRVLFGEAGEAAHVGEHHRDLARLAAELRACRRCSRCAPAAPARRSSRRRGAARCRSRSVSENWK